MPPTPRRTAQRGRTRRRVRKNIAVGQAHNKTSFNNTIVSLTDKEGNVIAWESAGSAGLERASARNGRFATMTSRGESRVFPCPDDAPKCAFSAR